QIANARSSGILNLWPLCWNGYVIAQNPMLPQLSLLRTDDGEFSAMQSDLPRQDVVLLGVGHTNAHVLRMWRMRPLPETRLTCVSDCETATYSGMLPGVLAEQYPPERMQIDLVRLCAAAGARLVLSRVTGVDLAQQRLLF